MLDKVNETYLPSRLLAFALALAPLHGAVAGAQDTGATGVAERPATRTLELYDVVKVVDGDTIHVERGGQVEKLRLLSVDTEEKISGGYRGSPTKPPTVYGEECALWAQRFFAELAPEDGRARVALRFPDGVEARDVYGRLLCHVLLPDGTDFNLLLVRTGKSPYFNKYGNSLICHEELVAAQRAARSRKLGIWDPDTNRPKTPDAPAARRPYDRLLPWWEARAQAVDDFRRRKREEPAAVVDAEDPADLERAVGREVEAFCSLFRIRPEGGDLRVELRATEPGRALAVRIPEAARPQHEELDLEGAQREFRQNYLYVRGVVERRPDGSYEMVSTGPSAWRRAGPEPERWALVSCLRTLEDLEGKSRASFRRRGRSPLAGPGITGRRSR